jgi:hypothetical protein
MSAWESEKEGETTIKQDLMEIGCEDGGWMEEDQDRVKCKVSY